MHMLQTAAASNACPSLSCWVHVSVFCMQNELIQQHSKHLCSWTHKQMTSGVTALGDASKMYLTQHIRMSLYNGVTRRLVALNGSVHKPQAKTHIQHISPIGANCLCQVLEIETTKHALYSTHTVKTPTPLILTLRILCSAT